MVTINYEALGQLHLFESGVLNPKRISAQGFQNAAGISPLVMGSEHYQLRCQDVVDRVPFLLDDSETVFKVEQQGQSLKHRFLESGGRRLAPEQLDFGQQEGKALVVYNPATGLDRRQIVKTSLREMGLEFEFEETTVQRNAEHIIASTPDMTAYKLVVVVGGDGTIHQAVNGLVRKGSIVPPVLLVPNGSGNDTCRSLGILSVEQALEILKKQQLIFIDLTKMILDKAETRYSVVNAGLSYTAAVAHKALAIKPYFGKYCYLAAGLAVFYGGFQPPMYRLDLYNHYQKEERLTYSADTDATIFSIFNGRYGGNGIPFAPLALMNDGLIDICFNKEEMRSADFRQACKQWYKEGGTHIYEHKKWEYLRGSRVQVTNLNYENGNLAPQHLQIDGEPFTFTHSLTAEAVPSALPVLLDTTALFSRTNLIPE